jgi:hypothetical protein
MSTLRLVLILWFMSFGNLLLQPYTSASLFGFHFQRYECSQNAIEPATHSIRLVKRSSELTETTDLHGHPVG